MDVNVATRNPIKLQAVRAAVARFHPDADVCVHAVELDVGTPDQPIGSEIEAGAIARARAAVRHGNADLGVGIEAGLMQLPGSGRWLSVQVCAIADREGRTSVGVGPGYELTDDIRDAVLAGEPLREAFCRILGVGDADRRGAVFHLTEGRIDRLALTEQAVLMALASRMTSKESPSLDLRSR